MNEFLAERLKAIPGFGIDRMADLADQLGDVIRMEKAIMYFANQLCR